MVETTAGPNTGVRASDAEREKTVATLHAALGEGRLDLRETETRVAAAYDARYRHELPELLVDLPPVPGSAWTEAGGPPSWQALWTALVWRVRSSVWDGPGDHATVPGQRQRRIAAALAVAAVLWLVLFVVLGIVAS